MRPIGIPATKGIVELSVFCFYFLTYIVKEPKFPFDESFDLPFDRKWLQTIENRINEM